MSAAKLVKFPKFVKGTWEHFPEFQVYEYYTGGQLAVTISTHQTYKVFRYIIGNFTLDEELNNAETDGFDIFVYAVWTYDNLKIEIPAMFARFK